MRARKLLSAAVGLTLALSLAHCADLAKSSPGTCGNGVIDAQEDCDSFPHGEGTVCRPAGGANACRLSCALTAKGVRSACPAGWGCGGDDLCREPTGEFDAPREVVTSGAWRLLAADFDGDGRREIVSRERADDLGFSKLRVHYLDRNAAVTRTVQVPSSVATPTVLDVSGDGHEDLLFGLVGALGVMLAETDGSLLPVAFPSYVMPSSYVRVLPLRGYLGPSDMQQIRLEAGPTGITLSDLDGTDTVAVTPKGKSVALAGEPVTADLVPGDNAPCDEIAFAVAGTRTARVHVPCIREKPGGDILWNDGATPITLSLPADAGLARGVLPADVDGDGNLDLLIGAEDGSTYVTYGDGKGGFREGTSSTSPGAANMAAPFLLTTAKAESLAPSLPLAAGSISDDGVVDYAFPEYVLASVPGSPPGKPVYAYLAYQGRTPWSRAFIGDVNGNGKNDVVLASKDDLDVDVLSGNGGLALNAFTVGTDRPVAQLAVADYDGDFVLDVAIAFASPVSQRDEVAIAYGRVASPPLPPVVVGRFPPVSQLAPFSGSVPGNVSSLDVVSEVASPAPEGATTTAVTVLEGNGDRQPRAPLYFKDDVNYVVPFGMAVSTGATGKDPYVVTLAADVPGDFASSVVTARAWLTPFAGSAALAPSAPVATFGATTTMGIAAALDRVPAVVARGDLDGDGDIDVLTFAATSEEEQVATIYTGLRSAQDTSGGVPPGMDFAERGPLPIRVATDGELAIADVDGDGKVDAIALTGAEGSARDLVVAFGDGAGGFDPALLSLREGDETPGGITLLTPRPGAPRAVAYVTGTSVRTVTVDAHRAVGVRKDLAAIDLATGVTAGDLDGDGIEDLAVAAHGAVLILRGKATHP